VLPQALARFSACCTAVHCRGVSVLSVSVQVHLNHSVSILALGIVDRRPPSTWETGGSSAEGPLVSKNGRLWYVSELLMDSRVQWSGRVTVSQPADCWLMLTKSGSVSQQGGVQTPGPSQTLSIALISEASSRDPFMFSTLRPPRCMEWMALVG